MNEHTESAGAPASDSVDALSNLRSNFNAAHREAERAAYALFGALPVGPERTRMAQVYENIRHATRVPLEG